MSSKKIVKAIRSMGHYDELTKLPNRRFFCQQVESYLSEGSVKESSILFIDLDEFNHINGALGQEIGDQLFLAVSERLKNRVTEFQAKVGRNRGDEFLVYLRDANEETTKELVDDILRCFSDSFYIDKYELHMTASIGVSIYPKDADTIEDLIKKADLAMHQAKRAGKNGYQFYEITYQGEDLETFELEMDLWNALENEELKLLYQPKVDLVTGKVTGAEALLRWIHPKKGVISPGEFIPLAERLGLIIPIGEWVLRRACLQAKEWVNQRFCPFSISVNLSVRQFYQANLAEVVNRILEETQLDPGYLELEITESMMVDSERTLKVLNELNKIGVKISLDDFGTGFSSLHYLKRSPIHKLKIDQSFIRQCTVDGNDAALVKTIISMAHKLDLEVIAEGVESGEQLIFLQHNLCDVAQGYLFSKPISPEEFKRQYHVLDKLVSQYGISKDIRHHKYVEKTLYSSLENLKETISKQQGMIFKFVKKDGKFIHTLCDGELMFRIGLFPELVLGKELYGFLPRQVADEKYQFYHRAWTGEARVSYECHLNGVDYLTSLSPVIKGGQVVEVIGSCIDITDRKRIENDLRKSESKNRLITENILDLILIIDPNGEIEYVSPSHKKVLGLSPEDLEKKTIFEVECFYGLNMGQTEFYQMITGGNPFKVEFSYPYRQEKWLYFEAQWTPVYSENNIIEHIVMVARDITDRKKTEEWLLKKEKLSVVGQLAPELAHEFRNPLTAIKGFLQLMEKGIYQPSYINLMLSEIASIEEVISNKIKIIRELEEDLPMVVFKKNE